MSDVKQGAGFRYGKVMAWAPPMVLALALILMFMGELTFGLLLAAFALIFWFVVRRRKQGEVEETGPGM